MLQLLTLAVLAFYVLSVTGCTSSNDAAPSSASSCSITIAETDTGFDPVNVTVQRGEKVQLTFVNKGLVIHNLRIAVGGQFGSATDVVVGNPVVQPGQSASIEWTVPAKAGVLHFRCDVHPTHTGTITVL
jgi:plastocyanin